MDLGVYAHPWDLRDLRLPLGPVRTADATEASVPRAGGGLGALRDLGFGQLSLAAAYHAGKWLTPWSSDGFIRELEDGTVHFPPRGNYGVLRPEASAEGRRAGDVEWLRVGEDAAAVGMTVRAWTVFTHNSRLGALHPQSAIHNARGDRLVWGLCPARPEVAEYISALAADVGALPGLGVLEIEALGWMGNRHGSHHAKAAFADDPVTDFLLSYCFCDACRAGLGAHGVDPGGLAERVVGVLGERLTHGDAMAPPQVPEGVPPTAGAADQLAALLGVDVLAGMLDHRRSVILERLRDVRATVPDAVKLAAHVVWDPLFTGSQLGIEPTHIGGLLDELVATHYGQGPHKIIAAWMPGPALPDGMDASVAVFPVAPHFTADGDLTRMGAALGEAQVGALRIYHAGLLPWATLVRVAGALQATH